MRELVLASQNEKKVRELEEILAGLPVQVLSLKNFQNAPSVEEDGATFEENAAKKALAIARFTGKPALADDSGLCVEALGGAPGVRSARYAGPAKKDSDNCLKLLDEMKRVPEGKRRASFICAIALALPDRLVGTVRGECHGEIARDMKGEKGFGYDPLFIDPASGKRFAELDSGEKNRISHRARALQAAKALIAEAIR